MGVVYLAALLGGIVSMLLIDHRFKLFFWHDPKSASIVTIVGLVVLLVWDFAGIYLGIFFRGDGQIATGIVLAPELPIEEPVFLTFLILCTMVLYTGIARIYRHMSQRAVS